MGIMHIQSEDYFRLCIHVCIRGMVFVQKGNWSFRIAELVGTLASVWREEAAFLAGAMKS